MTSDVWHTARSRWRNISLFAALVTKEYYSGALPKEMDQTYRALVTLTEALEHSTDERKVFQAGPEHTHTVQHLVWCELPAAVNWIKVVGDEIYEVAVRQQKYPRLPPGPLWASEGGTREVTPARWTFWQRRFRELVEWDGIESILRGECGQASARLCAIAKQPSPRTDWTSDPSWKPKQTQTDLSIE